MAECYQIRYAAQAADDVRGLRAFDRKLIVELIEQHLLFEPTRISRSKIERMEQPFWSQYRLRGGDFRVYYDVDEPARIVLVVRVLYKGVKHTEEKP